MTKITPIGFKNLIRIHSLGANITIDPIKTYDLALSYRVSFPNGFTLCASNTGSSDQWVVVINGDAQNMRCSLTQREFVDLCEEYSRRTDKPEVVESETETRIGRRSMMLTPISFDGLMKIHSLGAKHICMEPIESCWLSYIITFPKGSLYAQKWASADLWNVAGDTTGWNLTEDELIALCEEFSKPEGGESETEA